MIRIADYIGGSSAEREVQIDLDHPAQQNIRFNKRQWVSTPDEKSLLRILRDNLWILPLTVAALDTQLRSYKKFKRAPYTVYNFVIDKSDQVFTAVLGAMNFTSAAQYADSRPQELHIKEKKDLDSWRKCTERLVLIRTATGSLLSPILKELMEQERIAYCDGLLTTSLPTIPIVRCRSFFHRREVKDVSIEKDLSMLTASDLDTIRAMIANTLSWDAANIIYKNWRKKMSAGCQYITDRRKCWNEAILETLIEKNFISPTIRTRVKKC